MFNFCYNLQRIGVKCFSQCLSSPVKCLRFFISINFKWVNWDVSTRVLHDFNGVQQNLQFICRLFRILSELFKSKIKTNICFALCNYFTLCVFSRSYTYCLLCWALWNFKLTAFSVVSLFYIFIIYILLSILSPCLFIYYFLMCAKCLVRTRNVTERWKSAQEFLRFERRKNGNFQQCEKPFFFYCCKIRIYY